MEELETLRTPARTGDLVNMAMLDREVLTARMDDTEIDVEVEEGVGGLLVVIVIVVYEVLRVIIVELKELTSFRTPAETERLICVEVWDCPLLDAEIDAGVTTEI